MFKCIQKSYDKHKPKNITGFISYLYIVYKICELLDLDHITKLPQKMKEN